MTDNTAAVIDRDGLGALIEALAGAGYQVIGPQRVDGAIVYEPLASADDLPVGWVDHQAPGRYRLERGERPALFDYVVGPHSWKRYLFPPRQRLWRAERRGQGFRVESETDAPAYAFIGVRGCELQAMAIQDKVFADGAYADPGYVERRRAAFIVAVNCARPAATCFCTAQGSGPKAGPGYDLALTELLDDDRHEFLTETGSERGRELLQSLPQRSASAADRKAAEAVSAAAEASIDRTLDPDAEGILKRNLEHAHWDDVARRCLSCGNCTLVCPTCFCTTVEDHTDLSGDVAERWRHWDSCYSIDFSYLHGGSIRTGGAARYRQWLTHKLAHWHDQFDSSGCVGCGRCITWCPVGIDLTAEVAAIGAREAETSK
ncbi:MAG: 4Fe-4S dicluster domain-containing protein [Candidatus Competibacterales bacterium]|nr:4Fe-4S dicluster domain-containing protein [Candidatus Competibacterales bacterium]